MANRTVKWVGSPDAQCQALTEHGYPLTVERGESYSLPASVAKSLVESTDGWQFVKQPAKKKPKSAPAAPAAAEEGAE